MSNNYFKVRANYYDYDKNKSGELTAHDESNYSTHINVSADAGVADFSPCVSVEYTGNPYGENDVVTGGIKINDGFCCTFRADTPFIDNNGYNGCISFVWSDKSLGNNAIPPNCIASNYTNAVAPENKGLFDSSFQNIKGLSITLFPEEFSENDTYKTKLSRYLISYKNINQLEYKSGSFPDIDLFDKNGFYPVDVTLSVEHVNNEYWFILNGTKFASIYDVLLDMDSWGENDGFFTTTLIAAHYISANLEIREIENFNKHLTREEKVNLNNLGVSVLNYHNGGPDYTEAFQNALKDESVRRVYVPGGTYVLSGELTIRENCELELAQDAVLSFTDTTKNCISMKRSASLVGNHATIIVPYGFTANVINIDTDNDWTPGEPNEEGEKAAITAEVPPFEKWDPQWKLTRYIRDINITKPDPEGIHYSNTGDCYGTAIYIRAASNDEYSGVPHYLWGMNASGIRIAGGFEYGIYAKNEGEAWNHDMRVEALTQACKVGAYLENCNNSRLAVSVQPIAAYDTSVTPSVYTVAYATNGIYLKNCKNIDLSGSRVWDWSDEDGEAETDDSLWAWKNEYQHIRLDGDCSGLILDDFLYYHMRNYNIRDLIYTLTPENFESMTILQEPVSKFFDIGTTNTYLKDRVYIKAEYIEGLDQRIDAIINGQG